MCTLRQDITIGFLTSLQNYIIEMVGEIDNTRGRLVIHAEEEARQAIKMLGKFEMKSA